MSARKLLFLAPRTITKFIKLSFIPKIAIIHTRAYIPITRYSQSRSRVAFATCFCGVCVYIYIYVKEFPQVYGFLRVSLSLCIDRPRARLHGETVISALFVWISPRTVVEIRNKLQCAARDIYILTSRAAILSFAKVQRLILVGKRKIYSTYFNVMYIDIYITATAFIFISLMGRFFSRLSRGYKELENNVRLSGRNSFCRYGEKDE